MARLVEDVLDYLEAGGHVGGATGWARAASYLPPKDPDQVVAIFETPGGEPELAPIGSTETEYDEVGFQVRVRGEEFDYAAARDKIGDVYQALHGSDLGSVTTGELAYVLVWAVQSGPFPLGLDENDRPGLTWNFRALRERG